MYTMTIGIFIHHLKINQKINDTVTELEKYT